ncbi:methyltransferase domain-containing protein [Clostridium senegalense]|uniref:Class I SAM-dependent methyltransferase n=1 Tax=Clostridium senegalense TaxID=1465809 RepID=A0A6M0H8I0_9CLOT|nr:class I SAM-dependent methyltransferase [Clostridium senegalense]
MDKKFNVNKMDKLNNPERLKLIKIDKIITELYLKKNPTIVDIGIGTGVFSKEFLNKIPNSKGYGFDISNDMIKWINENMKTELSGRLVVDVMEENKIPLEDNSADLVFMITVHHELDAPIELLKDAKRVLKDKGKILICDWKEGCHKHFVTKESIIDDLENADLHNVKAVNASEKLLCLICEK